MDDPDLAPEAHRAALVGLARLNRAAAVDRALFGPLAALALERPGRPLRVLELASGGGDDAIALARRARRAGLAFEIVGLDVRPFAVEHARRAAARAGVDGVEFRVADVLADELPTGHDVVLSCLFLHHLDDEDVIELLARSARAAARAVVMHDLARSAFGHCLAAVAPRLLTRSAVVHADARTSVDAAWRADEWRLLAARAGLADARVRERFPARIELVWRRA